MLIFIIIVLVAFGSESVFRNSAICSGDRYYLPTQKFWSLEETTNLFGQHDGRESLILYRIPITGEDIKVKVKKNNGTKRIIILGSSSAVGFGVAEKESFASLIQAKLNNYFGNDKFEVINGAIRGYVSYQLLVYFEEVLLKLSPDIVVFYFGSNDGYTGNITDREYYEKIKKVAENIKYNSVKRKRLFKYGLLGLNPIYSFLAESRLFGYIKLELLNAYNHPSKLIRGTQRVPLSDEEYVFQRFSFLSKKYNFRLIFMPEIVKGNFRNNFMLIPFYGLMKEIASKDNVIFIDLEPLFREYTDDKVLLDTCHPTAFGHSLIADKLFETILNILSG